MTKPVIHSDTFAEILKIAEPAMSEADLLERFEVDDAMPKSLEPAHDKRLMQAVALLDRIKYVYRHGLEDDPELADDAQVFLRGLIDENTEVA